MAKYKLDQWKNLSAEWNASGMTREKFCSEKDVTVATFSYWRTKLNKLEKVGIEKSSRAEFVHLGYFHLPGNLRYGQFLPIGKKFEDINGALHGSHTAGLHSFFT